MSSCDADKCLSPPGSPGALRTRRAGEAEIELSLGWNQTAVSLVEMLHNSLSGNQGRVLNLIETARRISVDGLIAEAGTYSKTRAYSSLVVSGTATLFHLIDPVASISEMRRLKFTAQTVPERTGLRTCPVGFWLLFIFRIT